MLPYISTQKDYARFHKEAMPLLSETDRNHLNKKKFRKALRKMRLLEPERVKLLLLDCYSKTGRPALDPIITLRSFILMLHFGYTSVDNWVHDVRDDKALQYLIGNWHVPSVASHYDFINRILRVKPNLNELYMKGKNSTANKKKYRKLHKGDKWENYDEGDTFDLAKKYWENADCDFNRPTRTLENVFDQLVVRISFEKFIKENFTLSGDGTSVHIHSNKYGHAVKNPVDKQHTHRYTAPDADIGWDSDEGRYYLGFTMFTICFHVTEGIDLPMFITQRTASQHDAITAIPAIAQMLDVNPNLKPKYFCFDSACDAEAIYSFLRHKGMLPIIDRHPGRLLLKDIIEFPRTEHAADGKPLEYINREGKPICACGFEMYRDGYDKSKGAIKFCCPLQAGKVSECQLVKGGKPCRKVLNVYDKTSYKFFGPIEYRSDKWKEHYKNRTSTERINKRILRDYKIQDLTCCNGSKHFFFEIIAGINIHLDSWLKNVA